MLINSVNTISAYSIAPLRSVNFDEPIGIVQSPVVAPDTDSSSKNNVAGNSSAPSAELFNEISKQYSYKSPIARLKESNTHSEKPKTDEKVNSVKNGKFELDGSEDTEEYSSQPITNNRYNSGYIVTLPNEHLAKMAANSKLEESDFNIKSLYYPNLRTRNGALVNLML